MRDKLVNLIMASGCVSGFAGSLADYLISHGVTFAADNNVALNWISIEEDKPDDFVSVLGHMTDAGEFPAIRECYKVGCGFYFPALREIHPISHWAEMPGRLNNVNDKTIVQQLEELAQKI